jgi:serine acetyltransferase
MLSRIREDIKSVFHRDPAARNTMEVLFNYPACMQFGCIGLVINYGSGSFTG